MVTEKVCSTCKELKSASEFYKTDKVKSGLISQCKECCKKWQQQNKDRRKAICKRYAEKQSSKEKKKAWTDSNRERINKRANELRTIKRWEGRERPEVIGRKASIQKYYQSNKDKYCHQRAVRRAVTLQATPVWANKQKILKIYKLLKRLNAITPRKYHVDHIVPLNGKTVCGLHNEFNLRIVDSKENLAKSNKVWPDMP